MVGHSIVWGAGPMAVEDTSASLDAGSSGSAAVPYSQAWWHERSSDELRLMMSRGFELGPAFDGATAEAERRARERLAAEERALSERDARNKGIRRIVLEALLLATLLVLIASAITR